MPDALSLCQLFLSLSFFVLSTLIDVVLDFLHQLEFLLGLGLGNTLALLFALSHPEDRSFLSQRNDLEESVSFFMSNLLLDALEHVRLMLEEPAVCLLFLLKNFHGEV